MAYAGGDLVQRVDDLLRAARDADPSQVADVVEKHVTDVGAARRLDLVFTALVLALGGSIDQGAAQTSTQTARPVGRRGWSS